MARTFKHTPEDAAARAAEGIAKFPDAMEEYLVKLGFFREARGPMLRDEVDRLAFKHGRGHPLVDEGVRRYEANALSLEVIVDLYEKVRIEGPDPDDAAWIAYGRVVDSDGAPVTKAIIALFGANNRPIAAVDPVATDQNGLFELHLPIGKASAKDRDEGERVPGRDVYLAVIDERGTVRFRDSHLYEAIAGEVEFCEVVTAKGGR